MKYTSNGGDPHRKAKIIKDVESMVWGNSPSIWPSRLPLREPSRPALQQQTKPYKTIVREGALSKMRNPTTYDDRRWEEKWHHEQREPSPNVGKKGKCIVQMKVSRSTLIARTPFPARLMHARYGGKLYQKD
jgi:hypothetical protein